MLMTKAQQRSLQTLHEDLAKKMHELYTEINGVLADVDIAFVDQTTYAELIASLSRPSASYTFSVPPLARDPSSWTTACRSLTASSNMGCWETWCSDASSTSWGTGCRLQA